MLKDQWGARMMKQYIVHVLGWHDRIESADDPNAAREKALRAPGVLQIGEYGTDGGDPVREAYSLHRTLKTS